MAYSSIAKGIRPEPLLGDEELEIEGAPGTELGVDEEQATVTEGSDGSVTIEFGDPNVEAPTLGFGDNLAKTLDDDELNKIGDDLKTAIEADDLSRADWKKAIEEGMTLLGLMYEERCEPFKGASGVVHPILNEAVIQFQAQAYKELLPPGGPARTAMYGQAGLDKEQQAERIRHYINYMITEVMEEFDPEFDQMLYHLGFGGSAFKKVYYDGELERPVSPYILAKDLIVPYSARDMLTAERVTHVVTLSENALRKLQVSGFYLDVDLKPETLRADEIKDKTDDITGIEDQGDPENFELYECHCNVDIPGHEKLYPEGHELAGEPTGVACPHVVTLERTTGKVIAIRRNYSENDPKYRKKQYFVHYKFLPGLGFYGFGLVHLLGNIARGGTSTLRQLIDAGTLANLQGGFKVKGLRVANEKEPIQPGEWRDVDAPNGDLNGALYPIPFKEPSPTLFSLLEFLIGAAEKFIGTTDLGMGDSNQELPVGSVIALLERGSRVLSSVHKRLHYSQKQELKLLAEVMGEALPDEYPFEFAGQERTVKKSDFDARIDVIPVSDPNIFSMTQRIALAQEQYKLAQTAPQLHNMYEAHRRMYSALGVTDINEILPPPQEPKAETPATEHAKLLSVSGAQPLKAFQEQSHESHLKQHILMFNSPVTALVPGAQVGLMQHILEHIFFAAKGKVIQQMPELAQQDPAQPLPPEVQAQITEIEGQILGPILQTLKTSMVNSQDPLIALKQQELTIKKDSEETKKSQGQQKLALEVKDQQIEHAEKERDQALQLQMHKDKMMQAEQKARQDNLMNKFKLAQDTAEFSRDSKMQSLEFTRDTIEKDHQLRQKSKEKPSGSR